MNPFENRIQALSGPATDALPVAPTISPICRMSPSAFMSRPAAPSAW